MEQINISTREETDSLSFETVDLMMEKHRKLLLEREILQANVRKLSEAVLLIFNKEASEVPLLAEDLDFSSCQHYDEADIKYMIESDVLDLPSKLESLMKENLDALTEMITQIEGAEDRISFLKDSFARQRREIERSRNKSPFQRWKEKNPTASSSMKDRQPKWDATRQLNFLSTSRSPFAVRFVDSDTAERSPELPQMLNSPLGSPRDPSHSFHEAGSEFEMDEVLERSRSRSSASGRSKFSQFSSSTLGSISITDGVESPSFEDFELHEKVTANLNSQINSLKRQVISKKRLVIEFEKKAKAERERHSKEAERIQERIDFAEKIISDVESAKRNLGIRLANVRNDLEDSTNAVAKIMAEYGRKQAHLGKDAVSKGDQLRAVLNESKQVDIKKELALCEQQVELAQLEKEKEEVMKEIREVEEKIRFGKMQSNV